MNCQNHPDLPATAFCRACGKALCAQCQRTAQGTVFCEEHVPAQAPSATPGAAESPWTAAPTSAPPSAPRPGVSPGLAFILGFIPGVGAIYNGQYAKGIIHVVVLGLLISIVSAGATGGMEALFGLLITLWFFYMAFEAYHTAKKRQWGQPVDEFSSLFPIRGEGFPAAPIVLIALGVLFLLHNLDILRFHQIARYWPVALIAAGVYLLYVRVAGSGPQAPGEGSHERS